MSNFALFLIDDFSRFSKQNKKLKSVGKCQRFLFCLRESPRV